MNPVKELDELYTKDAKIPQIDLEVFAQEQIKKDEENKFNSEMANLQKELDQLESGKYLRLIHQRKLVRPNPRSFHYFFKTRPIAIP